MPPGLRIFLWPFGLHRRSLECILVVFDLLSKGGDGDVDEVTDNVGVGGGFQEFLLFPILAGELAIVEVGCCEVGVGVGIFTIT